MERSRSTDNLKYDEEFILNSRGLKLFTCQWIPIKQEPKALVFICHGYAMECSITMNSTANRLANQGYAVYGMDYEGHGKSSGLEGYVENMDNIIDDCSKHYSNICERAENKEKMRYLLGESMGGAVVLLLHKKMPDFWDGAILAAPMCKIAEDMKPPTMVINVLSKLSNYIPTWRLVPGKDIIDLAFKVPEVRDQVRSNPYCYKGRPRLKTGLELVRTTMEIEKWLHKVSLPFLVLHGEDDKVTDKAISKKLHEDASSADKTIKLYPEMWHGLLYGEPLENIEIVFKDIIGWLNDRATLGNPRLERQQKERNDDSSKSG
ncbi:caffeoylshikimate esterase-like [Euphorbia lathyris]|uniref:caffeoylshikimate esterase-like n=1 Tax=Euphorbia lathyris TaxID=212925 RepID=UPI003313813A